MDRSRSVAVMGRGLALLLVGLSAGCTGTVTEARPAGPRGCADGCEDRPAPTSRAPRLSHLQYENATRDLLRLDAAAGVSSTFLGDPTTGLFDNDGSELSVGGALWSDYQRAAEALAERVTSDPDALARLAPADPSLERPARVEAFIRDLLSRAFRRDLEDEEVARYAALAARSPELFVDLDPFVGAARLILEAALQSPHFLYRVERSAPEDGATSFPLSSHEVAALLSFALWNSVPDEELREAAASGTLADPEVVRAQAERMLADPRARPMVEDFHSQWIDLSAVADVDRAPTLFPEFDPDLPASMEREHNRFVEQVVFEDGGGLATLLTAPFTFVDPLLARVYGVETPAEGWTRVDFADGRRGGLFTQIAFLSIQATSTASDPIHRGVHLNRRVLCADLPAPPMNVSPLPAEDPSVARTLRQRIDLHTGEGTCGARCHGQRINPIGFAFEHFDALGRWQDLDNGLPVDASAEYEFESGTVGYDGATDLAQVMSEQPETHHCYVGHWLEYLYGRRRHGVDDLLVRRLGQRSREDALAVRELILELVTSEAFMWRSAVELEDPEEGT